MTTSITIEQAAEMLDSEQASAILAGKLRLAGFRIMHYYGDRILASENEIKEFCAQGIYDCDGCERDHFIELLCQLNSGYFHIYDVDRDECDKYFDFDKPIMTFDYFMNEEIF